MWQPSKAAEAFKQKSQEEWWQEQEQRRLVEDQRRQQQIASQLSAVERDSYYRKLLGELTLDDCDRLDLERRGFTLEQIAADGYRSVSQWQKLSGSYPINLPGILINNTLNSQAGYLCPVHDVDGLIVGMQIRLRDESSGRYRWLTSATKHNPDGATPHLDGQLPLAVYHPDVYQSNAIWLTEGLGLKPSLVCDRLEVPVIGASSGRFDISLDIFKTSIDQLSVKYQTSTLIVAPDSGDVKNSNVCQRWADVFNALEGLGHTVQVAWWGQVTKEASDIDELADLSQIQRISIADFNAICREHGGLKPEQDSEQEQQSAQGFQLKSESKDQVLKSEPTGEGWDNWRKSRLFTADQIFNEKHFRAELPRINTLTSGLSGLGTGKSRWITGVVLKAFADAGILSIGYRNSNLIQFGEDAKEFADVDFYHLQRDLKDKETEILIADPSSKISCCIDSLIHFQPSDFDGKIVILDEIESIVSHLLRANTAVGFFRERIKTLFAEMLNRASRIICLDGHSTDTTIDYLQSLQSNPKELIKIQNLYQGNRGRVEFYEGAEFGSELKVNDYSPVFEAIRNNQNCFAVGSDSQTKIESLDIILKKQGRKTLRLDSTTSTQKWVAVFLKNPAKYLREHKIEIFLYSPSAEAGLNIDIQNYFSDLYFLFFGVITTSAQMQMMGRIRDPQALLHVYCKQQGLPSEAVSKSPIPKQLQEEIKTYVKDCAMASLTGIDKQDLILELALKLVDFSGDRHFEQETKLIALENHERANLRECLRISLIHSGYQLTSARGQKSDTRQLTDQDTEVKAMKATSIFEARDMTSQQANESASNFQATLEDKAAVTRRRLLDRLPGIQDATYSATVPTESTESEPSAANDDLQTQYQQVEKPVFSPELIKRVKFDDRALISKLELRWLIMNPEEAQKLQQVRWYKKLALFTDLDEPDCARKMSLSNYSSRWLKVSTLLDMGIEYFLQPGATWSDDTPQLMEFYRKGKDPKFFRAIRTKVGDSTPCEYLGRVLKSLELKTKSTFHQKKRVYQVDSDYLADPVLNAIFEAVGRRFEDYLFSDKADVNWRLISQSQGTQTQLQQALEGDTPSANLVKENQPGVSVNRMQLVGQSQGTQTQSQQVLEGDTPSANLVKENQLGVFLDEWLSLHNLESMAVDLEAAASDSQDGEELFRVMRLSWPVKALKAASRLLPHQTRQTLKRWVLDQNSAGWSAA